MAKAKSRKKTAPKKAVKKTAKKSVKKAGKTGAIAARPAMPAFEKRRAAKSPAAEIRLPLSPPVRVAPAPRPMSAAQRMPMPVPADRPIAPIQLRQPSRFRRELPTDDDRK